MTASLFYATDDEGEKLNSKGLNKDIDLSGLPNIEIVNWQIDEIKMVEYMVKHSLT